MATSANSDNGDPGFQIAPMVDVVFVLMLFFMASAGMRTFEKELPIQLSGSGPFEANPPVVIAIGGDGSVSVNEHIYGAANDKSLTALRTWLHDCIHDFGLTQPVIIRPDFDTRHDRIMDVLNATSACGVKKVTFG